MPAGAKPESESRDYNPCELTDIGVQGCLNKPYSRETLLREIDRVLHNEREK